MKSSWKIRTYPQLYDALTLFKVLSMLELFSYTKHILSAVKDRAVWLPWSSTEECNGT